MILTLEFISVLLPEVMHSKKQIGLHSRSCAGRILRCAAVPVSLKMHLLAGSPIMVVLLLLLFGGPHVPHIVRVGGNHEDAACLCGIEPNKGPAEEVSRSEQRA